MKMGYLKVLLASALFAAVGFADETRLLSGFYDPTIENAWTLVLTGTVNGGDPVPDDQPAQDGDYGLISDARGWVCKVKVVSAEKKTLKFGVAAKDLFKEWPATVADRQLDLTGPVTRGAESWTITQVSKEGADFMQLDNGSLIKMSLFRAPKTLTSGFYKPFRGSGGVYQDNMVTMILDCPQLIGSGIGNDQFCAYMKGLKQVYFNLPSDTDSFGVILNAQNGKLSETDVSDWVLTKTPTLNNTSTFQANFTGTGVLCFPSVTALADRALAASKITGLEIGTLKTSTAVTVGASAAAGASLTNVVLGGGGCSFAIDTNAFACANLTRVTLNGGVPTWTNEGLVFGTVETPARSMVFTVELCDDWTAVMMSEAVTPLTAAERAAYAAAHPGETVPYGVAVPSIFRTAAEQYVAYPKFISFSLLGDSIGRGTAKVYDANGVELTSGMYYPDEVFGELTLVATPETADDAFAEWEGIVSRTAVRDNPLVFTYDESKMGLKVVPRFNRTWLYTPGEGNAGTLTQGDWTLNCYVSDAVDRQLTLGQQNVKASLFATPDGLGLLDLTGKVSTESGDEWTIVSTGVSLGYTSNKNDDADDPKNLRRIDVLYLPTTLTSFLARDFYHWTSKGTGLSKFVMDCPNVSVKLGKWMLHYLKAGNMVLRLPKVTETAATDSLMEYGGAGAETDFGNWNFEALETIGKHAIYASSSAGGVLAFPSARRVCAAAFIDLGADAIEFGRSTDKAVGLETVEAGAATGAAHLKELSFLSKPAFTAGEKTFAGSTALEKVTILGRPIDATSLSNIVSAVSAASDKTCSIYVGYKVRGTSGESWTDLVDPNLTPDEEPFRPADRPDAKFLGVINNPVRNCWVFGIDSPYDPKGMLLLLR